MNRNSKKIVAIMLLVILLVILSIIATAEHFEWIEANWLGGTAELREE